MGVMASLWTYFIPLYVLGGLAVLLLLFTLVARIQNGRYVRPLVTLLAKVPLFKRWMTKAYKTAVERQNPELASAMEKLERVGQKNLRDPQRAQQALQRLTPAERRAWMEAAEQQGVLPEAPNRAMRRQQQRMRKRT